MSKPLSSFPLETKMQVIMRRIKGDTKGLGHLAAQDALKRLQAQSKKAPFPVAAAMAKMGAKG